MTSWEEIEKQQKVLCNKLNVTWTPVDRNLMIAVNSSLFSPIQPINALRHPKQEKIDGWYMWSGGEIPQDRDDFFSPVHVEHLMEQRPEVLKYLALPYGWRFQIDDNGYEDVWYDPEILNI